MNNSINYTNNIIDAIQTIVDNAVKNAGYDRTLKATISKCIDSTIGKYIVDYQDSSFYAYSTSTDVSYSDGAAVYVLVPANDLSQNKTILGTVDKLGTDYVSALETEEGYEVIGTNIIGSHSGFGLCSYSGGETKTLYDKNANINLINLDTFAASTYLQNSNYILLGANFKTNLSSEQRLQGDYGIIFELEFIDNNTEEVITKNYVLNIDRMSGNPYNFSNGSRQVDVFEIDGENFSNISKIYIFDRNFPKTEEGKSNDIFVTNIELNAAKELSLDEIQNCGLSLITQKGSYFDNNDLDTDKLPIKAQIMVKGKAIDSDNQDAEYYWFRENNKINRVNAKFNTYGGEGWECLNDYNTIDTEELTTQVIKWLPADYLYNVTKSQNVAKATKYKCVAIYNGTIVSKEITIYNFSSQYNITIKSDLGTQFYYDLGLPTLKCYINGVEDTSQYTYVWSSLDNNNEYSVIEETTTKNTQYNNAVTQRNTLLQKVANEQMLSGKASSQIEEYQEIIDSYDTITRVEKNTIYHLKVNNIVSFTTFKCAVYKGTQYVGTAEITIFNDIKNTNDYTLIINDGNQVFKYNENGLAPDSEANIDPQIIMPLSFTLYDDKGMKVEDSAIALRDIEWTIPTKNTLLSADSSQGTPIKTDDTSATYNNSRVFNFNIAKGYNAKYINNEIQLSVAYKDKVINTKSNLVFTKQGEIGTNGTDFVCKIIPNEKNGKTNLDKYITIYHNSTLADTSNYTLNYERPSGQEGKWFKVQLWHDGIKIFDSTGTGATLEGDNAEVTWSIVKNTYARNIADSSNLVYNSETSNFSINSTELDNPANMVKCTVKYQGKIYYDVMPVIFVNIKNTKYTADLNKNTGFRNVLYTTDGQLPSYNNEKPFTLTVRKLVEGIKEDVSQLELSEHRVNYSWSVTGQTYRSNWQSESNLIYQSTKSSIEKRNEKYYIPADSFDGLAVNNGFKCDIRELDSKTTNPVVTIYIPVYMYLNKYGNAALNEWDGNSISIDEDKGIILAPQVGAGGKKDGENGFTGIFMGDIQESGKSQSEYGLYGYNNGERTVAISAENGSARFGKIGAGQIVIDPSKNQAIIESGNYSTTDKTGMQINLTDGTISTGSGKFRVDSDGSVHATEFALITDLENGTIKIPTSGVTGLDTKLETVDELDKTVQKFQAKLSKQVITIPCSNDYAVSAGITNTIQAVLTYKGEAITSYDVSKLSITSDDMPSNAMTITKSFENSIVTISFTTKEKTYSVTTTDDLLYTYHLTFLYPGSTEQIKQDVTVELVPSGKSGSKITVSSTDLAYAESTDGVNIPIDSEFKSTPPATRAENTYLWTRTIVHYVSDDGASAGNSTSYSVAGKGSKGTSVKYIKPIYYLATNTIPSTPVHNTIVSTDITNKWTYLIPTFVANATYYTCNETCYNTTPLTYEFTDITNDSAFNKAIETATAVQSDFNTFTTTTYVNDLANLQNQIDGAIQFWNGEAIPTLTNYPAQDWTTEELRLAHQADIYTVIKDEEGELKQGKSYRFDKVNNTWQWIELTDNELSAVQALAQSKAKVFVTQPTPPYKTGDLWLKDQELYECKAGINKDSGDFAESDWEKATKYTDDTKANQAIKAVEVKYILSNSYSDAPSPTDSGWSTTAPEWTAGKYMWQMTTTYYVGDPTTPVNSNPTCIQGAMGTDVTTVLLTNEFASLIATSNGKATTGQTCETQVLGYKGSSSINVKVKKVNNITAAVTDTDTGITGLKFKVSSISAANDIVVTFTPTTEYISKTLRIPIEIECNGITFSKYITINLNIPGASGTAARTYEIYSDVLTIVKTAEDILEPGSVTFTSYYRSGTSATKNNYSGRWLIQTSTDGSTWTTQYTSSGNEQSKLFNLTDNTIKLVRAYLGPSGNTPTEANAIDIVTIPVLNDSTDINIGGVNLVNGTSADWQDIEVSTYSGTICESENFFGLEVGDEYVYRVKIHGTTSGKNLKARIQFYTSTDKRTSIYAKEPYITTEDGYSYIKSTLTENQRNHTKMQLLIDANTEGVTGNTTEQYCEVKLEKGNVATEWTPSQYDVDEAIQQARKAGLDADAKADQAQIDANSANIAAKNANIAAGDAKTAAEVARKSSILTTGSKYYQQKCTYRALTNDELNYDVSRIYYIYNDVANTYEQTRPEWSDDYATMGTAKTLTAGTYYIRVLPTEPDNTNYASWEATKPSWKDEYVTFCVPFIKYKDSAEYPDEYGNVYVLDSNILSIDDKRYLDSSSVLQGMRGSNNIYYNESGFYVYNGSDASVSTRCIYISNTGINMAQRETTLDSWKTSSVWTIDGEFDASKINVTHLNADSIMNGVLTLGRSASDDKSGVISTPVDGKMIVKDDTGFENIVLDTRRACFKLSNGGYVVIGKDIGLQVCDSNGNIQYGSSLTWTAVSSGKYGENVNYYSSENITTLLSPVAIGDTPADYTEGATISKTVYTVSSGDIFEVAKQKVNSEINYYNTIKTMYVAATDKGGSGIAFVKTY